VSLSTWFVVVFAAIVFLLAFGAWMGIE